LVSDEHIEFETHATRKVATLVSKYSRGISLDVGCGKGPYLEYFRGDVVLVDINHYFVSEAIARYRGSHEICGIVADIRELPLPPDSFDFILVSEVLEHLNGMDLRSSIESLKSITRKYLQIDVPNDSSLMHLIRGIAVSARVYKKQAHDDDALEHHVRIDSRTLVENGFMVKGCINAVSRNRLKLGPIWNLYDRLVWNAPHLAGTLIGLYVKTDERA
jgi:SAM-dependent methyltransferase